MFFLTISLILGVFLPYIFSNTKFNVVFKTIKVITIGFLCLIYFILLIKFTLYIKQYDLYETFTQSIYMRRVLIKLFGFSIFVHFNASAFSDILLLLCMSSGVVSLILLGEKNLTKFTSNLNLFSSFFIIVSLMVYTTNLLTMFISFELLFLPTLYFVYTQGYVKKSDRTLKILLLWTLAGAFLILSSVSYLYFKFKTLNFFTLNSKTLTLYESYMLYIAIFIGFGVKIPVFPFHFWLTKIHVEAPAGFSIFLSGFLVKAALFCFFYFNILIQTPFLKYVTCLIALLGMCEASLKMFTQTDFKKLIAYATIQEMNIILFLLLQTQNLIEYGVLLFVLIHGWLSTLMFFYVDIIQKKTKTRNLLFLAGIGQNAPSLKIMAWIIILLYSGFPLTIKFAVEWYFLATLIYLSPMASYYLFFVISFFGTVGLVKQFFLLLYGTPNQTFEINISKRDKDLFYTVVTVLCYLNFIHFFLF